MTPSPGLWPGGKRSAICLTYDDALNVHLDIVMPQLDSAGFRATFYIIGNAKVFYRRIAEWESAAKRGHELGNHTVFHPCCGATAGREWVKPDYDLNGYTVQRMIDEIRLENDILASLDGRTSRTFAYPCGDTRIGGAEYLTDLRAEFAGARGVQPKIQRPDEIDLYEIGAHMMNGQTGGELTALAESAIAQQGLLVYLFHGVGGEHNIDVPADAHRALVRFLKDRERDVWVAPLADIADHIRRRRASARADQVAS